MQQKSELPEGWTETPLECILFSLESGSRPKGGVRGISEGIPSIGGEHLNESGGFRFDKIKFVAEEFFGKMNQGIIKVNDILIVKDGATTGKVAIVKKDFPYDRAAVNEHVFLCRPYSALSSDYIFYFLFSEIGQKRILNNFRGSAQGGINKSFAPNTMIPLPPLPEQHRIVSAIEALFARLDATNEKLDSVLEVLKKFRESVLAAACEGRLTENWRKENPIQNNQSILKVNKENVFTNSNSPIIPETWYVTNIQSFMSSNRQGIKTGPFGSMLKKHEYKTEGIPVLGIENVRNMKFIEGSKIKITPEKSQELVQYEAKHGDILITRSGTVGEICVVPAGIGEARISSNLMRLCLDEATVDPYFFCILFTGSNFVSDQLSSLCGGSTRDFINGRILKSLLFLLPPLPEQQEIFRRVDALFAFADSIEAKVAAAREKTEKLRQSILAKAFSGELVEIEAEIARREGRDYEMAEVLLERIKAEKGRNENKR